MNARRSCLLPQALVGLLLSVTLTPSVGAQTIVSGFGGNEMRYRGDTIWNQRDTTMSRAIFRGDTVFRSRYVHGRLVNTTTSVVRGDNATIIEQRDASGLVRAAPAPGTTSAGAALAEQQMLEQTVRSSAMMDLNKTIRAQTAAMGISMPAFDAPNSPAVVQRYAFTANTNIVQHGDTVRYITGCAEAPPVDSVVYVLFAYDSLRRVSASPRTFDRYMVAAVRGDMSSTLIQRAGTPGSKPTGLPGVRKWPCDRR